MTETFLTAAIFISGGLLLGEVIHAIFDKRGQFRHFWLIYLILMAVFLMIAFIISPRM